MPKLWGLVVRGAWIAIGVMIALSLAGSASSQRLLSLGSSATVEQGVVLGVAGIGFFQARDASGFAVPFISRWHEVIDGDTRAWSTASGSPRWFLRNETLYMTTRGGTVLVRSWFASYLPLAGLAMMVVTVHGLAWAARRARRAWRDWKAWQMRRRYPAEQHCPACGYDLRMSRDRCPECGNPFVRRTVILAAT